MGFAPAIATRRQRSRKALGSLPKIEPPQTKKRPPEGDRFAEGNRRSLALDLARMDLAGPLAGGRGTVLNELLEALEVVFNASRRRLRQRVGNFSDCALGWVVVDGELYLGVPID